MCLLDPFEGFKSQANKKTRTICHVIKLFQANSPNRFADVQRFDKCYRKKEND